jgi:hypothetical protein
MGEQGFSGMLDPLHFIKFEERGILKMESKRGLPRARRFYGKGLIWGVGLLVCACALKGGHGRKSTSPEGLIMNSSTFRMLSYEQTVTVKAAIPELWAWITETRNIASRSVRVEPRKGVAPGEPLRLGDSFPITAKFMGMEIPGRLIVVKLDEDRVWMVWENPVGLGLLRWEIKEAKDGVRYTTQSAFEIGENVEQLADIPVVSDRLLKERDFMMATTQAHFDPSLDPEKLTAVGLRGERYESLIQVYECRGYVQAPPKELQAWIADPKNFSRILAEIKSEDMEKKVDHYLNTAGPDEVLYLPGVLEIGVIRSKVDGFLTMTEKGGLRSYRFYMITFGIISIIEVQLSPEAEGTRLQVKYISEVPSALSGESMDLLLLMSKVPQMMEERFLMIQKEAAKKGLAFRSGADGR